MEMPDDGLAVQSAKDECDINRIIAKYQKTGVVTHIATYGPTYGDYQAVDFQEAMETITEGTEMFMSLPSTARKRFGNSPAAFMEYINDPETNPEDLRKLGLSRPVSPSDPLPATQPPAGENNASDGA